MLTILMIFGPMALAIAYVVWNEQQMSGKNTTILGCYLDRNF